MKELILSLILSLNLITPIFAQSNPNIVNYPEMLPSSENAEDLKENSEFNIKMSFTGDVMIAAYKNQTKSGNFNDYANNNPPEYFLQNVKSIFEEDDFTIVNLENVLTDNTLKEVKKNHSPAYWYRSKTENTQILTSSSVEGVSLSNNHTGDYGTQGTKDTIAAVEKAELNYGTNDKIMYFEKNGFKIAVICNGLWSESQATTIAKRIKEAEEFSDFQIVFYHGGTERQHAPDEWRKRASRKLVDAGADLVVGNHPHVLQPIENYKGVDIIYSMGNFCFGGSNKPENRTIIYQLNLTVKENKVITKTNNIIPCYLYTTPLNNFCPTPITDEKDKQKVLDFISWKVKSPI